MWDSELPWDTELPFVDTTTSLYAQPFLSFAARAEYSNGLALPLCSHCVHSRHPEGVVT